MMARDGTCCHHAVIMPACDYQGYASLHERFRLEVRILFYPMRTWKIGGLSDFNYCWHAGDGRNGGGSTGGGRRGGPGRSPSGVQRRSPRLSWNETKMFHKQILSRNEAWFVKIRKQMTTEQKKITRWFCPPLHLIPVWLNSPFPILTEQNYQKYYFTISKLFKH